MVCRSGRTGGRFSFDSCTCSLLQPVGTRQRIARTRVSARRTAESKCTRLFTWYTCISAAPGHELARRLVDDSELILAALAPNPSNCWTPVSSRLNCASPDFRFPLGGERGAAARWAGRGGIALGPPQLTRKRRLAGSTTKCLGVRVSAFGSSWSQRRRPSLLDQTNQTRTSWRGCILCLDKRRRPMRFLPWLPFWPFWSPLSRP